MMSEERIIIERFNLEEDLSDKRYFLMELQKLIKRLYEELEELKENEEQ